MTGLFQTMDSSIAAGLFPSLVDRVVHCRDRIEISHDGQSDCVLISKAELDGLERALEILSDHPLTAPLREHLLELAAGDVEGFCNSPQATIRRPPLALVSGTINSQLNFQTPF